MEGINREINNLNYWKNGTCISTIQFTTIIKFEEGLSENYECGAKPLDSSTKLQVAI